MLRVSSLKLTIILQFVLIITPIALVLLYQVLIDVRRANSAHFERQALVLAQQSENSYRTFLNGLADAVDTGRISSKAVQSLAITKDSLLALQSWDVASSVEPLLGPIDSLLSSARRNPAIEAVLPLRPAVNHVSERLKELVREREFRVQQNIENFAQDTKRQEWVVLIVMCVTLMSAVGFIYRMIKGLTEPLARAVALAEDIAAGKFKSDEHIDTSRDIGGLLASLAAMRGDLRKSFLDLANNEARLANAQRIAEIGDWELGLASGSVTRSEGIYAIFGRQRGDLSDTSGIPLEIVHRDDKQMVEKALYAAQHRGEAFSIDFRIVMPTGDIRHVHGEAEVKRNDKGEQIAVSGTVQDITQRKLAERELQHLALHDGLTGLPNRDLFTAQAEKALAVAGRSEQTLAMLFLDLDRFKNINDSLGHHVGDSLLKQTADRITQCLRKSDIASHGPGVPSNEIIARMGGDEFTILLTNVRHAEDAARVAERILNALTLPFDIAGNEVFITASIGIAVYPIDGGDFEILVKNADAAMYDAKAMGRNNYQFFTQSMKQEASLRLSLENDLRKALTLGQFVLHYQPQIDISTRKIFGVEALIRWQHPQRGLVPPLEFIPIAEESGLITKIGEWVMHEACAQVSAWHRAGLAKISVAVNMASPSFRQGNLMQVASSALDASGLDARYLELELTESIMVDHLDTVIPMLNHLKGIGILLSIDDFGTGYSSLSYLQRFPIDALKIDRAFIRNLDTPEGTALVQAIIAMAKSLSLQVIAEGVETETQANFLLENHCEKMQGFLYSKPLPAGEMTQLLQKQSIDSLVAGSPA